MTDRANVERVARAVAQYRLGGDAFNAANLARVALGEMPAEPLLQTELALCLLALGQGEEAWPLFESRLTLQPPPSLPFERWRGQPLDGRRLLVVGERGLPAVFLDYLEPLKARGLALTLLCPPELADEAARRGLEPIVMSGKVEFADPDYWIPLGSLPGALGASAGPLRAWAGSISVTPAPSPASTPS